MIHFNNRSLSSFKSINNLWSPQFSILWSIKLVKNSSSESTLEDEAWALKVSTRSPFLDLPIKELRISGGCKEIVGGKSTY